jgi:RES domain-containing protein
VTLWRISRFADLAGTGGLFASGRWHTRGRPVVYLSDHPASCLLEMLVQGPRLSLPPSFRWLRVEVAGVAPEPHAALPDDWRTDAVATRRLGDTWLATRSSALLQVPSVIVPHASNYLLNPRHPDAARLAIRDVIEYPLDPRVARRV